MGEGLNMFKVQQKLLGTVPKSSRNNLQAPMHIIGYGGVFLWDKRD